MRRSTTSGTNTSGYDSFLDIVANLVGILLILIMVIGVRTRDAWQRAGAGLLTTATPAGLGASQAHHQQVIDDIALAKTELQKLQDNTIELDHKAQELEAVIAAKNSEREHLQYLVTAAQQALDDVGRNMGADEQAQLQQAQRVSGAEDHLADLRQQMNAVAALSQQAEELRHEVSPLAKTVTGQEEHFRLQGGRIVYVPINELSKRMNQDAESKLWKLNHVDNIVETLPAVDGFRLRYALEIVDQRRVVDGTPVRQRVIELQYFHVYAVEDAPGEFVDKALQPGSVFQQRLSTMSPTDTSIALWTYPDSFEDFRKVQHFLAERGFATAAWPRAAGDPIGGSKSGRASAAQ